MEEKKKVPAVRFKGFTGDWERRKLGDFTERVTRKNENLESNLPLTISAQYGLIDQNQFFDKRIASKDVSGYYLIRNGEFAYNKSTSKDAPWGAIKRLDRYKAGVLSTLYIVFKINESQNMDSDFLVSYYETDLWHKEVQGIAAEGARNHGLLNVAPGDFFKTKLYVPADIKEQKKVGRYFKDVDHLLTLHQQKLDQLKKLKAYFLQNLFPAKGEKVPKIRFKGFTGEWEERKMSDYLETSRDKNFSGKYSKEEVLSVSGDYGIVNQIEFQGRSFAGASVLNYGVVNTGDVVYTKSPLKLNPYGIIKANKGRAGIVSTLYAVYHPKKKTDANFVECYFNNDWRLNNYLHPLVNKGAKNDMKVTADDALKGKVTFPSKREEQVTISKFITKVENLITLHQQKIAQLQAVKKFLLQNLFV